MNGKTVEFIYDRSMRRPKRLENNVFVLYTPEKIILMPGEVKTIKMKLKLRLASELVGCCTLLQTFSDNNIVLLSSQHILSELNTAGVNPPVNSPWNLTLTFQ